MTLLERATRLFEAEKAKNEADAATIADLQSRNTGLQTALDAAAQAEQPLADAITAEENRVGVIPPQ